MSQELQAIARKIGELEQEKEEHLLVIDTLKPLKDRNCYRLVGGVLVKSTAEETLPQLEGNLEQINEMILTLGKSYKQKEDEIQKQKK
jgi:prefoldin subunit 2